MPDNRISLLDLTRAELTARLAERGFSPVHAARLWSYLYWDCATSLEAMPELPVKVRVWLEEAFALPVPVVANEVHSTDGYTRKFLLALSDGRQIETVAMRFTGRMTACVSTQAGCAMGCVFCATGQQGFQRQLAAGEIVAQALHIQRLLRAVGIAPGTTAHERLRNLVLMGMGEPLNNYDAVMQAVDILRASSGLAIAAARITLSTVGVVPGIVRMADEARPMSLAVSLHAATAEERAALMPVARRWPLDELMKACRYYCEKLQRRIFFEWTLIDGQNDTEAQAHALGQLLRGLPAQVNLIPLNPTTGFSGRPGQGTAAKRFQQILDEHYGLPSTIRQRRGVDIAAGCGQLAGSRPVSA